ncbi:16S rRNA (cytidine(1402)-2'-O)-methyltransferase [Alicyclobacillus sp. ALC3]|nr:16S rRNA (cytidine(1402)-2'-O)-methyltransferase [Alicyclobacillus sp. ALC3]
MVASFATEGPRLYVCSTPIGNLQDVSLRLLDVLRTADVVAAEDTRQTRKLLTHFDIHPQQLVSYHEHNLRDRAPDLMRWWSEGKTIALVTDAGTPGISDPGDDAVGLAIKQGVPVVPVPGPSAVLAAIVASGLPSLPFTFVGFLPRVNRELRKVLDDLDRALGSVVLYESPHRLVGTLEKLAERWPERQAVLAKELTKRHEGFARGTLIELARYVTEVHPRGEYVIVLAAVVSQRGDEGVVEATSLAQAVAAVRRAMAEGMSHSEAVQEAALSHGVRRRDLYRLTLP